MGTQFVITVKNIQSKGSLCFPLMLNVAFDGISVAANEKSLKRFVTEVSKLNPKKSCEKVKEGKLHLLSNMEMV